MSSDKLYMYYAKCKGEVGTTTLHRLENFTSPASTSLNTIRRSIMRKVKSGGNFIAHLHPASYVANPENYAIYGFDVLNNQPLPMKINALSTKQKKEWLKYKAEHSL